MTEADRKIVSSLADDLEALATRNWKRMEGDGTPMPVRLEDVHGMVMNKSSEVVDVLREHGIGAPYLTAFLLNFNPSPQRLAEVVNELRLAIP